MKIEGVIQIVNAYCNDHQYSRARQLILSEWKRLTESKNYHLLNNSAQEFIKIIKNEKEKGILDILSNTDKKTLNLINASVKNSQFSYVKKIFLENQELLEIDIAQRWLTSDSKIIYEAWKKSLS